MACHDGAKAPVFQASSNDDSTPARPVAFSSRVLSSEASVPKACLNLVGVDVRPVMAGLQRKQWQESP